MQKERFNGIMDNSKILLSICIPTYNRLDILRKTILSIYSDLYDVNFEEFEVIVSDNSKDHSSQSLIKEFNYLNLHYFISECEGFLNSFFAMSYGKGQYIKLNNNYTMFRQGTLKKIIDEIKLCQKNKTQIIFTNGLRGEKSILKFNKFDDYILGLNYFCSWSAGYGMWREDFERVKDSVRLNKYYPQTSLLFTQYYKDSFEIDDMILFEDQFIQNKGGYNIFQVFSVEFLSLLKEGLNNGLISCPTFMKIKKDLLFKFLSVRYFKTVIARLDNFEKNDIKKNILVNYTLWQYYLMIIVAFFAPIINLKRKVSRKL